MATSEANDTPALNTANTANTAPAANDQQRPPAAAQASAAAPARDFRDTLQARGWLLRRADGSATARKSPTHLLLDGGRVAVPDDAAGQFLNEYALAVVRGARPAAVELRTKVFRLFMDVDARLAAGADFDFDAMVRCVAREAAAFFASPGAVVVCRAPLKTEDGGVVKHGIHLVWPEVFATADAALAFRAALIPRLRAECGEAPFVNSWEDVMDKCVYTSNGLRMPWSVKGRGAEGRPYVPVAECKVDGALQHVGEVAGVAALREWVRRLCIRAPGAAASALCEGVAVPTTVAGGGSSGILGGLGALGGAGGVASRHRLEQYADVLPQVAEALPAEYRPQEFTGLFVTPHSVMLRSTSHYCANLGRAHKSNTVYFVVSRGGVTQRCFCRCETTDGRIYGMCKDFDSPPFPGMPQNAVDRLLGAALAAGACAKAEADARVVAAMPSAKRKSASQLDAILSRGVKARAGTRKRRTAAEHDDA